MKPALPIDPVLPQVAEGLRRHGTLLLLAPTGSGKTTRVPPFLAEALPEARAGGEVVVLEPRRLAARAAAARVAAEAGSELGGYAGYQVRGERRVSRGTRVRFVTEGVLVRRLVQDPFLEGVAAVVLDEFHERNLEGDLALAMLREVRETVRPELRLCVMSATLDAAPLRAFLPGSAEVQAEGRLHPVRIVHDLRRDDDPLEHRVRAAVDRALRETPGDVLVFLPGTGEIQRCEQVLEGLARQGDCLVLPLHGRLDPAAQDRAIQPQSRRKVVLSTNVAESSITIDGVTAVVDAGLHRVLHHDPVRGVDVLDVERISLASATQRAGRAGRTAPGVCYRLWTAGEERGMAAADLPDIRRVDLCGPALQVRAFASRDPRDFRWFEAPDREALLRADRLLADLGAVDPTSGRVTGVGSELLDLPIHPRLGRVVLAGRRHGCGEAAAAAAALLAEAPDLGRGPAGDEVADLLVAVDELLGTGRGGVAAGRRLGLPAGVARAVEQTRARLAGGGRPVADRDPDALARCLLLGFPDRVCMRGGRSPRDGTMVGGRGVELPAACDGHDLVLALRLFEAGGGRTRSRVVLAAPLEETWLEQVGPGSVAAAVRAELDESSGRVVAVREVRYRDLVLRSARGGELPDSAAAELLAPLLRRDPWRWLGEQKDLRRMLARAAWLRARAPDLDLPEWDDAAVAEAALGLRSGSDLRGLRDAHLAPLLLATLTPVQRRALEHDAPDRLQLPSGRGAIVDYAAAGGPTVAARIQELFGLAATPRLAGGRVPLVLEIQGPNHRPVQVTSDLASFWTSVYPQVRRELSRRYPRHAWPEDPVAAQPQLRPRRRERP